MKKILIICGPTASGKTTLGLSLAKKFNGEIISADSRQVYRALDIGTGKDLPQNSKCQMPNSNLGENVCFYEIGGVRVWGYDLVEPHKDFSVSAYVKFVKRIIGQIWQERKLPILIGGTGLYIKGVIDGIATSFVPPNKSLRMNLEGKRVEELFETLAQLDSIKAGSMNISDKKNPRRLIRAIEIAQYKLEGKDVFEKHSAGIGESVLFIGLTDEKRALQARIEKRVDERIKNGIEAEVKKLLDEGVGWDSQAMKSLGYRQWQDYFESKKSQKEVIRLWKQEEKQYAKRQMTWFKKDKRISWFNSSDSKLSKKVEKLVQKWYKIN
jgi:tRNA dimethylallyltransferase